jgi:long-chain acyl-CoA synthetase
MILEHSQSKVLVCEDQEQVDKLMAIREPTRPGAEPIQTPALTQVLVLDPRGTRGYDEPRLLAFEDFLQRGQSLLDAEPDFVERRLAELDPDAPAMVVYTSGTTGTPKGAMISSGNACAMIDAFSEVIATGPDDLILSYLPLCHVAEKIYSVFLPLSTGVVVHFGESIETVQDDLREVSPTIFLGVPRIWEKMASMVLTRMQDASWPARTLYAYFERRGRAIDTRRRRGLATWLDGLLWLLGDLLIFRPLQERLGLRRCWLPGSGAAPIAPELLRWFHGLGIPIVEGYGMTELAGVSHINPPSQLRVGTVGPPIPALEQRVADDGELLLRGPSVFLGYLHDAAATRDAIDEDAWLHTGDLAEIDDDGYLRIVGRKKEIIITSGGKNLSPEKIENALKTSPYIKEAVAIGDARQFVSALVQIEYETVSRWAQEQGLTHTSYEDLASRPEVARLVEQEVQRCNAQMARVEQVRSFRVLPKELRQDDGELTPTQKVRRTVIGERFGALIEQMYAA